MNKLWAMKAGKMKLHSGEDCKTENVREEKQQCSKWKEHKLSRISISFQLETWKPSLLHPSLGDKTGTWSQPN